MAGGMGTRLHPLTLITNKHLLPVYDKPMILYPLETLRRSGISEIMIVCGKEHAGHFMSFLGSGKDYGVKLSYALQHGSGGIAEALGLAEDFVLPGEKMAVILGDNIFENDFKESVENFKKDGAAKVFLKEVSDPHRFGVVELNGNRVTNIVEKPKEPKSNYITVGIYLYNREVFGKIRQLKPSWRGELELTDVHNMYIASGALSYEFVKGYWSDVGTKESLLKTANWLANGEKNGYKIN